MNSVSYIETLTCRWHTCQPLKHEIFGHNYCKSYDIISNLICIINDHMHVQINSCNPVSINYVIDS